jgi:hypothetical protein
MEILASSLECVASSNDLTRWLPSECLCSITDTDSSVCDLVVNISGVILDEKWNATEAIIDSLLEAEGKGELDKSNDNNESDFRKSMKRLPLGLKNRHAACILCQRLSQFLFHNWIPESLEKIRQASRPVAAEALARHWKQSMVPKQVNWRQKLIFRKR